MKELTATRSIDRSYQCRCIMLDHNLVEQRGSHCEEKVTPDSPFCRHCETRHPELPRERVLVYIEGERHD